MAASTRSALPFRPIVSPTVNSLMAGWAADVRRRGLEGVQMTADDALFSRWDQALEYIREWLDYRRWMYRIPGMQVAIRYGGKLRLSATFGVTSEASARPVTAASLFRIASQSKTFTATAVLQLVERGLLRLDDPLRVHIAELGDGSAVGDVTLRELLTHTSGLICDGWGTDRGQLLAPSPGEGEILRTAIEEGRVLAPLTVAKYSNLGYNLLGIAVARASEMSFADYLRKHIIGPLGLTNTGPDFEPTRQNEFVHGHSGLHLSPTRRVLPFVHSKATAPCGGLYSTAEDLSSYFEAHLAGDPRLLSDRSKRLMQHPEWADPAVLEGDLSFSPGMKSQTIGAQLFLGQPGGHPGGQASLSTLAPSTGLVVSILTNSIDAPVGALMTGVLELLELAGADPRDGRGPGIVREVVEEPLVEMQPEVASRFVGRFSTEWGVTDIAALGGKLFAIGHRGAVSPRVSATRLVLTAPHELRYVGAASGLLGERLHFVRDGDSITRIEGRGGMTLFPASTPRGGTA
jgi:CubicO group peptidase (beta-lactamase class C family)